MGKRKNEYLGDDGEIYYRTEPRRIRPSIIAALILAAASIIAAFITLIPVGSQGTPIICYFFSSTLSVCSGSIVNSNSESPVETQTPIAIVPTSTPTQALTLAPTTVVTEQAVDCDAPVASSFTNLSLYDNFNDAAFDDEFNPDLWVRDELEQISISQHDDKLVFEASNPPTNDGSWLVPLTAERVNLQSVNAIQADFSWEQGVSGLLYLGLTIAQNPWEANDLAYTCDFLIQSNSSVFVCSNWATPQYRTSEYSVTPDQAHSVLIEFDQSSSTYYTYLDGQCVDAYKLPKLPQYVNYDVHLGTDANSSGKAYVDNVSLGSPK